MAAVTWSALVFLVMQIFFTNIIRCCVMKDPKNKIDSDFMVYDSKYIIYGEILRKIKPDPRTPAIETSYGVELKIKCIYKGDVNDVRLKDKDTIIIAGAGVVKDGCYSMEVDENVDYVVFLSEDGDHLVPSYGTPELESDPYELVVVCGLNPVGPRGQAVNPEDCPSSNKKPDCISYSPPTEPPTKNATMKPTENKATTTKMPVKVVTKGTVVNPEKDVQTNTDNAGSNISYNLAFCLVLCSLSAFLMS